MDETSMASHRAAVTRRPSSAKCPICIGCMPSEFVKLLQNWTEPENKSPTPHSLFRKKFLNEKLDSGFRYVLLSAKVVEGDASI